MGACGSKSTSLSTDAVTVDVTEHEQDGGSQYDSSVDEKRSSVTASLVKQHVADAKLEDAYHTRGAKVLGKGAYGVVTTCRRVGTEDQFALKTISLELCGAEDLEEMQKEIDILRRLDHPNIVRIFETFLHRPAGELHVVMELLSGGDLRDRLRKRGAGYPEALAGRYIRSMSGAVLYCHEHGVRPPRRQPLLPVTARDCP